MVISITDMFLFSVLFRHSHCLDFDQIKERQCPYLIYSNIGVWKSIICFPCFIDIAKTLLSIRYVYWQHHTTPVNKDTVSSLWVIQTTSKNLGTRLKQLLFYRYHHIQYLYWFWHRITIPDQLCILKIVDNWKTQMV